VKRRMTVRRGLTLVEVLLATALTALLAVAVGGYLQMVLRSAAQAMEPSGWRRAAEATLRIIADDLRTGAQSSDGGHERVIVRGRELQILSGFGEGWEGLGVRYRWDSATGELLRRAPRGITGSATDRPLLGRLNQFELALCEEDGRLRVVIGSVHGMVVGEFEQW